MTKEQLKELEDLRDETSSALLRKLLQIREYGALSESEWCCMAIFVLVNENARLKTNAPLMEELPASVLSMTELTIGKWYRLEFPGTFAKVIKYDSSGTPYSWFVRTLVIQDRWWVDKDGNPNNHASPRMIVK